MELTSSEDISVKYKQIEELFYSEMNFYEFIELIFFTDRRTEIFIFDAYCDGYDAILYLE